MNGKEYGKRQRSRDIKHMLKRVENIEQVSQDPDEGKGAVGSETVPLLVRLVKLPLGQANDKRKEGNQDKLEEP